MMLHVVRTRYGGRSFPLRRLYNLTKVTLQCLSTASHSQWGTDFPGPSMKTKIPGPKSQELIAAMDQIQETRTVHMFVDYEKSWGNYIVDVDGNRLLDVCGQIASSSLGYNNPDVIDALKDPAHLHLLVNRPALGFAPPAEFVTLLKTALLSITPSGLNQVITMMCGACAVESAFKTAFIHYRTLQREQHRIEETREDAETSMVNQPPGSPKLSVLSFHGGFHGRTFAALSATHSKYIHKLDLPAFDWPTAPFPHLRYPLEENERENRQEEDSCLEQVSDIIDKWSDKGSPVACICVEPIQGEGGDYHATPYFFKQLQKIAKQSGALLLIDEVQTFGATGRLWAHEAFELDEAPDLVTFAKKLQVTGAYVKQGLRPDRPLRIFNTWMGEPSKLLVANAVVKAIQRDNLLQSTKEAGEVLLGGLKALQPRKPVSTQLKWRGGFARWRRTSHPLLTSKTRYSFLSAARGAGTICAIDCDSSHRQDLLLKALNNKGAYTIGSGDRTIRLRPSLTFQAHHANVFLNIFDSVLAEENH